MRTSAVASCLKVHIAHWRHYIMHKGIRLLQIVILTLRSMDGSEWVITAIVLFRPSCVYSWRLTIVCLRSSDDWRTRNSAFVLFKSSSAQDLSGDSHRALAHGTKKKPWWLWFTYLLTHSYISILLSVEIKDGINYTVYSMPEWLHNVLD